MANIIAFDGKTPDIHPDTFLAISADIIGDVSLAEGVNIWNNATIRGDISYIRIGKYTNVQDGCVIHVDRPRSDQPGWGPTIIGDYVTIGHGAIVHACTVEDTCLIGMGAIVLDGAVIGKGSIVGAGALVPPNAKIPPFSMVLGTPGKVVKTLLPESLEDRLNHAKIYYEYAKKYE
ncbi:MAG: gamma carbonic anhydrase family protein [Oscillospiraceae bacterium]|nr:gamma carbonic anhydrase family protein [Oscillospiraceae bacterium]